MQDEARYSKKQDEARNSKMRQDIARRSKMRQEIARS